MRITIRISSQPDRPGGKFEVISTNSGTLHVQKFVERPDGDGPSLTSHMSIPDAEIARELGEALLAIANRFLRGN